MRSRLQIILFTVFAPVTVPLYLLFLAAANLLGGAFYVVVEATAARVVRRPISLTRKQMVLLTVPVLVVAPLAMIVLLLAWFFHLFVASIVWIGHWQTKARTRSSAFFAGALWCLVALWTTVTCLNAAVGSTWIGRPVAGADLFVDVLTRQRTLGALPREAQDRRRQMIRDLEERREAVHPDWQRIKSGLEDDDNQAHWLGQSISRKLCGLPWYFDPAEVSEDGADHSVLLLGPLIFAGLVLIRWPGTFSLITHQAGRAVWMGVRLLVAAYSIYALMTWVPLTDYFSFYFEADKMPPAFVLCPAV